MRKHLNIWQVILVLSAISPSVCGQEPNPYFSAWDSLDLSDNKLPVMMPYNRIIDPAGEQIYFGDPYFENHALDCALSPDMNTLAIQGREEIIFYDLEKDEIDYELLPGALNLFREALNTYSGIKWFRKGNDQYVVWSMVCQRRSYVVSAKWDGHTAVITNQYLFLPAAPSRVALPNEVEIISEGSKDFFIVTLSGNNQVLKIDSETGTIIWETNVGVAPFGVVEANGKLYVTNWGGSIPDESDPNVAGVPWGKAKVDPLTGSIREGTVSVLDPNSGEVLKEIEVGLHPNDIVKSQDEEYVYISNANSDNVSVINTSLDQVTETISVRLMGDGNPFWGSSPNGLAIARNRKRLYVANGMDNAVAVVDLGSNASSKGKTEKSMVAGFIPTGAYPGGLCLNVNELYVANIEAEGARIGFKHLTPTNEPAYNSRHMMASVSRIFLPGKKKLASYTERVLKASQLFRINLTLEEPRKDAAPVPVPLRIGEPSVFKHVVYIIKENRTYDQILGDMPEGDGEPALCIFGEETTPNTHRLARQFQLLDNYHVSGKNSAEGHQWTDASIVTDEIEKSVNSYTWFRGYPHVQTNALTYSPNGFIWDNAVSHGKSVRIYGEACIPLFSDTLDWTKIYQGFLNDRPFYFRNRTTINPIKKILSQKYPGYDHHAIPDVLRAKTFIEELHEYEKMEGDQWPELSIVALPNDHTAGTDPGFPTPRAMVADNDLALGQIVEAITKSRFWENTVIFVTEDDSQDGWDHVSAYRTVGIVISPYSQMQTTIGTQYNQTSLVRTIEQILGLPPMNILDATAMPMFDCFTSTPDNSSYEALPNMIPLDEMNPGLNALEGKALYFARQSMKPEFQHVDRGNDQLLNRILWHAMKGNEPYPKAFSGKGDKGEDKDEVEFWMEDGDDD